MLRFPFILLPALLLSALIPTASAAQDDACRAARVVSVAGTVRAVGAGGGEFLVTAGQWLCPGTRLITGPDGKLAIRLTEKRTVTRYSANAEIVLPESGADVNLFRGILHFLSSTPVRLRVQTPFVTAGIDGTEAVVHAVPGAGAVIAVREGLVRAIQPGREVPVNPGEVAFAPPGGAARLVGSADAPALPPVFRPYVLDFEGAVDWAIYYPPTLLAAADRSARAAADLLRAGRPDEAAAALRCAAAGAADASQEVRALCLLIAVARNDAAAAAQALASPPAAPGPAWRIAESYALQSSGDLRAAVDAAEAAVAAASSDAFARARLAELLLLRGAGSAAEAALGEAEGCRRQAHADAVAGFAALARSARKTALARFECAIAADPEAPLGWLGRGLARIRAGELEAGRDDLETAVALDPRRASLRTWLGRAYFETGEAKKARAQFDLAIAEDPDNPTARLFAALERFAANDPIAALRALDAASARGAAAAVVRDRRGLGEDEATRGVAIGRIYDVLGFQQLATRAATRAVTEDPTNPGAHRFLAETYAGRPGFEVAQASERLQADLFAPPSNALVQPSLDEPGIGLLDAAGAARFTFREFEPMFSSDGLRFGVSGLAGNRETLGGNLSASFQHGPFSLAAGHFHFESENFGENGELRHDITAVQARARPLGWLTLFTEFRRRETERGDPFDFLSRRQNQVIDVNVDDLRLHFGANARLGPDLDLTGLVTYRDRFVHTYRGGNTFSDEEGLSLQLRGDWRPMDGLTFTFGGDWGESEIVELRGPFASRPREVGDFSQSSLYAYADWTPVEFVTLSAGLSAARYESEKPPREPLELEELLPKIGVTLRPTPDLTLRAAWFRSFSRRLHFEQTLEPTTVAGFNQMFQEFNNSISETIGAGADWRATDRLRLGFEASSRDMIQFDPEVRKIFRSEYRYDKASAYAAVILSDRWAASASLEIDEIHFDPDGPYSQELDALVAPFTLSYFHPSGFFAAGTASFYRQNRSSRVTSPAGRIRSLTQERTTGAVVDAVVGYRLPDRRGVITLEANNILDRDVRFEHPQLRTQDLGARRFSRGLSVIARAALQF